MTKDKLIHTLKEDLKIKKEIIAVKAMKQAPSDIPQYEGQASPGMCAFVGEILKDGSVWYATKENLGCFEALTGTGTCVGSPVIGSIGPGTRMSCNPLAPISSAKSENSNSR